MAIGRDAALKFAERGAKVAVSARKLVGRLDHSGKRYRWGEAMPLAHGTCVRSSCRCV